MCSWHTAFLCTFSEADRQYVVCEIWKVSKDMYSNRASKTLDIKFCTSKYICYYWLIKHHQWFLHISILKFRFPVCHHISVYKIIVYLAFYILHLTSFHWAGYITNAFLGYRRQRLLGLVCRKGKISVKCRSVTPNEFAYQRTFDVSWPW